MNVFDNIQHQMTAAGASSPLLPSDLHLTTGGSNGSSVQNTDVTTALNQTLSPTSAHNKGVHHKGGLSTAQDHTPNNKMGGLNLAKLGQQFDTISQQLGSAIGDLPLNADFNQVFHGNKDQVVKELGQVQQGINTLLTTHPQQDEGVAGIKLHVIANQINIEQGFIEKGGVSSAIAVRDVQRDILDIVNNDPTLAATAKQHGEHGFTPLTPLQNPPQPFQDNAAQTKFLNQTDETLNNLLQQAMKFADGTVHSHDQPLLQQISAFDQKVSNFAGNQGGVYSARFNNELAQNGTSDTGLGQLIQGLKTHNNQLITAADTVLLANMGDVGANQIPADGSSFAFAATNATD